MQRLLKVIIVSFFLIHLMACAWFLMATLDDNIWKTWVGGRKVVNKTPIEQYIQAFYWTF